MGWRFHYFHDIIQVCANQVHVVQKSIVTYGIHGGLNIMITESKYPILEFDDNKAAKLNPKVRLCMKKRLAVRTRSSYIVF